ncbi:MAG: phosphodiester glycosidase family protein [Chthoniobacterales bacterium]
MNRWLTALLALSSAAPTALFAEWSLAFRKEQADLSGGATLVEREAEQGDTSVRIQGIFFSSKNYDFHVVDNPTPDQGTLGAAMTRGDFVAGVNGGYFHANWNPVGLAISHGKTTNDFERAKLLSGVFVVTDGNPRLIRSRDYEPSKDDTEALQCGPTLVENGASTVGLNDSRRARRTVVATDGKDRWAILIFSPVTLADTARLLSSRTVFPDFTSRSALNLDGGSSTALWAATDPKPLYRREIGHVRNYLAIEPK